MDVRLLSCTAPRPDRRAIAKTLEEVAEHTDPSLAQELTNILLEGSEIEIIVEDSVVSSAYRAFRKLSIDYEIVE